MTGLIKAVEAVLTTGKALEVPESGVDPAG